MCIAYTEKRLPKERRKTMCIVYAEERLPSLKTLKEIEKNYQTSVSIAWQEAGTVRWIKGIDKIESRYQFLQSLSLPILICFQDEFTSSKELASPFPISPTVPLDLNGETSLGVVAYDGILDRYKEIAMDAIIANRGALKPLSGPISASRYIAWFIFYYGIDFCQLIDSKVIGKIIVMTPYKVVKFGEFIKENGVYYSGSYPLKPFIITDKSIDNHVLGACKHVPDYEKCSIKSYNECRFVSFECPYKD